MNHLGALDHFHGEISRHGALSIEKGRTARGPNWERTEVDVRVSGALEKVATEVAVGINVTAVAIAYVMQRAPYVFPIIGGRKVEHLQANLAALDQIEYLESIMPFDSGYNDDWRRDQP
ncbi:uncharacterized protein EV420DRAFT_1612885 [Desarmillaria tabescens]|uniref:NADP-dependent oxidoreductase domain-containing protein n=1 Tax=Armillaria tabescens TaxID=1929756 RepID=A0AA39MEX3_ARMTA|nr:uncharacterized protein EV420DRAFT_1612885 [Desarmillaria tabescens]KAK0430955.1 hypothetical protein EV420DRAFT_1612885 [Desarmillaria tabescens]